MSTRTMGTLTGCIAEAIYAKKKKGMTCSMQYDYIMYDQTVLKNIKCVQRSLLVSSPSLLHLHDHRQTRPPPAQLEPRPRLQHPHPCLCEIYVYYDTDSMSYTCTTALHVMLS